MSISITNGDTTTNGIMRQLLVVHESQPEPELILYEGLIGQRERATSSVSVPAGENYVVSFQASGGYWFQGMCTLSEGGDYTLSRSPERGLGVFVLTDGHGSLKGTLEFEKDAAKSTRFLRHIPVAITPANLGDGKLSLQFTPDTAVVEIDHDTGYKTVWFLMDGNGGNWHVDLVKAVMSYESGGWDAAEQAVTANLQGPNHATHGPSNAIPYSIPTDILRHYKQGPDQASPPALVLKYSLQVSVDPEVQMEGPGA